MKNPKFTVKSIIALLTIAIMMLSALTAAAEGDYRINLVAPLGGTGIYCVDRLGIATDNYATGGILVSFYGEQTLFVTAQTIEEIGVPAQNTLLGEGENRYGHVGLYRLTSGEFQVNGNDENGKLYEFIFNATPNECHQVGLIGNDASGCPQQDCDGDGQIGN